MKGPHPETQTPERVSSAEEKKLLKRLRSINCNERNATKLASELSSVYGRLSPETEKEMMLFVFRGLEFHDMLKAVGKDTVRRIFLDHTEWLLWSSCPMGDNFRRRMLDEFAVFLPDEKLKSCLERIGSNLKSPNVTYNTIGEYVSIINTFSDAGMLETSDIDDFLEALCDNPAFKTTPYTENYLEKFVPDYAPSMSVPKVFNFLKEMVTEKLEDGPPDGPCGKFSIEDDEARVISGKTRDNVKECLLSMLALMPFLDRSGREEILSFVSGEECAGFVPGIAEKMNAHSLNPEFFERTIKTLIRNNRTDAMVKMMGKNSFIPVSRKAFDFVFDFVLSKGTCEEIFELLIYRRAMRSHAVKALDAAIEHLERGVRECRTKEDLDEIVSVARTVARCERIARAKQQMPAGQLERYVDVFIRPEMLYMDSSYSPFSYCDKDALSVVFEKAASKAVEERDVARAFGILSCLSDDETKDLIRLDTSRQVVSLLAEFLSECQSRTSSDDIADIESASERGYSSRIEDASHILLNFFAEKMERGAPGNMSGECAFAMSKFGCGVLFGKTRSGHRESEERERFLSAVLERLRDGNRQDVRDVLSSPPLMLETLVEYAKEKRPELDLPGMLASAAGNDFDGDVPVL